MNPQLAERMRAKMQQMELLVGNLKTRVEALEAGRVHLNADPSTIAGATLGKPQLGKPVRTSLGSGSVPGTMTVRRVAGGRQSNAAAAAAAHAASSAAPGSLPLEERLRATVAAPAALAPTNDLAGMLSSAVGLLDVISAALGVRGEPAPVASSELESEPSEAGELEWLGQEPDAATPPPVAP